MSSDLEKRHTQISFGTLERLKPSFRTAGFHDRHIGQEEVPGNHSINEHDAVDVSVTKRARSPDKDAIDPATGLKRLELVEALGPTVRAYKFVKRESPWRSYEKVFELRLGVGDLVTVAQRKDPSSGVVNMRKFPAPNGEEKLRILQQLRHRNIVSVLEVFSFEESFYVMFEHMPISLDHFAGICHYPGELQLASILGQVSSGTLHP